MTHRYAVNDLVYFIMLSCTWITCCKSVLRPCKCRQHRFWLNGETVLQIWHKKSCLHDTCWEHCEHVPVPESHPSPQTSAANNTFSQAMEIITVALDTDEKMEIFHNYHNKWIASDVRDDSSAIDWCTDVLLESGIFCVSEQVIHLTLGVTVSKTKQNNQHA